ncbi:hypothetical protein DAPPUDRAFT_326525 [Daphnia pulex]|uniref:Tetraspanin n=1 Tax=Daphnia pulex TaxID=6669 RepID=E9H809_DAPPU|nr:hypothetical protein DAPPUDRAFT_326525 [Daphnia pulex]|eukprot:EFX72125.1 hypothetical protein DAPPUDRAFT_326525 [Daphnia pulex]
MSFKKQNWGWMRHVLTALSVLIFFLGCIVIGYMSWVLATSTTVNRFLSGTLFLGASVLCILGEIGGIITLNIVQIQMECCGFSGPQEFAYSTLPIDDSCYEPHTDNSTDDDGSPIARSDWDETTFTTPHMRLKQVN